MMVVSSLVLSAVYLVFSDQIIAMFGGTVMFVLFIIHLMPHLGKTDFIQQELMGNPRIRTKTIGNVRLLYHCRQKN